MTPICHIESAPRVPGCEPRGKRPHDYGPGRICTIPGCGTTLRRTHKGSVCDPCIYDAKVHARATAREAPATPAHATKEEKVGKEDRREDVLLVFARDPSRCFNAGDVVGYSGVSPSCVYKNLKSLVASGDLVKDGPGVYRLPKTEDAKTAPAPKPQEPPNVTFKGGEKPRETPYKPSRIRLEQLMLATLESAPGAYFSARSLAREFGVEIEDIDATVARLEINGEHVIRRVTAETIIDGGEYGMLLKPNLAPASPPAPAPSTSGEQPADEAPASGPLPPQAGLAPFAGIASTMVLGYGMSRELRILSGLEDLDDAARERVLGYAFARWPGKLDIVREVEVRYPSTDRLATEILNTLDCFARTRP